ncbi:MAG: hypothetical protein KKF44_04235 [Nanoarchaeota archaeon]|nr:hypothetical protein [Nanoarchaeota archaeon]
MIKRHLKRQSAPVTWKVNRKGTKFIVRPNPGKSYDLSMPISLIFKNLLNICKTTKEVKSILMDKEVIIDGKRRKDHKYTMGVMDVMSFPVSDEHYRMVFDGKGKLSLIKIEKKEADVRPFKIKGTKLLKKGVMQLNFLEGKTMLPKKGEKYQKGDVLLLNSSTNQVVETFKLEKGAFVAIIAGSQRGKNGIVEKIENKVITIRTNNKEELSTDIKYAMALGKDKPAIKIS